MEKEECTRRRVVGGIISRRASRRSERDSEIESAGRESAEREESVGGKGKLVRVRFMVRGKPKVGLISIGNRRLAPSLRLGTKLRSRMTIVILGRA